METRFRIRSNSYRHREQDRDPNREQNLFSIEQLKDHDQVVWLFVLELARRGWKSRSKNEADQVALLLDAAGAPVRGVERTVWRHRIHLAAAIARTRIKNGAFSYDLETPIGTRYLGTNWIISDFYRLKPPPPLMAIGITLSHSPTVPTLGTHSKSSSRSWIAELLPAHLRDERLASCINKEYLTGWVNTFKVKKMATLIQRLHDLGYSYTKSKNLMSKEYSFDRVCPRFMTIRPAENESIGQLDIVKNGLIVLQEREFCEGAANLCRILRATSLRGAVAQTHASSPRCSAYLAAQLKELAAVVKATTPSAPVTPQLGKLVVFGAGDNVESYVKTLRDLGVEASAATGITHKDTGCYVWVLSEPVDSGEAVVMSALDGVVAALATPPNSYSAVTDPIDLVCSRGGDLAMLEILTESEIDDKSRTRVQSILEEQKKTLKALLSKPQIQLILYETHSCLAAENQAQVARAVAEANRLARERHLFLKKRHRETIYSANVKVMDAKDASMLLTQGTQMDKDDELVTDTATDLRDVDMTSSTPNTGRTVDSVLTKQSDDSGKKRIRSGSTKARPIPEIGAKGGERIPKDPDQDWADVSVPNCDLFEVRNLPNIGNGLDISQILEREGCYLSLIQRKEVTSLDAKYMIRMAEERGLFGSEGPAPTVRPKNIKETPSKQRRPKASGFKVGRISAPTQASLARALKQLDGSMELGGPMHQFCPRCQRRGAAASLFCATACTCDQRHRHNLQTSKSVKPGSAPASQQCRRPYPLTVHDVRLRLLSSRQKRLHFIESIL
ncbi:hypothetical protein EVAR_96820_1 [Eumeta japonica]|uniref:Uncharacterized protein n=1 Tax=Eumeta variegata TaxID=151549 RepID=A0A4C1WAZ7_EUMVA|nr:hypothetical protein EVAR_96820_1 [Eumeta japonica]